MSDLIHGHCASEFSAVRDAFSENFEKRSELGASVCIIQNGETVVDLWGGHKDLLKRKKWEENTISLVFSCTKAATALCLHKLIDEGRIGLDDKVESVWPEFSTNGKENVTIRMMLNHSSAVPAVRAPVKPGGYYDFNYMTKRLAKEKPFWAPGVTGGYHMITFGWTVGEIVRRISGKSLGEYFKTEIAEPYGVDFHIGLPDSEFSRASKMVPFVPAPDDAKSDFVKALLSNPASIQFLALFNSGGHMFDLPAAWRAEIGGGGGLANARALAKMFAPLIGSTSYLSAARIEDMRTPSMENELDRTLLIPTRFAQGFMLSMNNKAIAGEGNSAILSQDAFGHVGMGGSIGFADPEAGFTFGYSMNKMGGGILLNDRGQSLVDAAYKSVGYKKESGGHWSK